MASLTVMKESRKWRSGRARERMGLMAPSTRGGEMPHPFGNDERVAAEDDGDVVVPSGERTSLEVVEPELALHLFIDTLGAPSLLEDAYDLLLAQPASQRCEEELGGLFLAVGPLEDQPYGGASLGVMGDLYAAEGEPREHLALRSVAPCDATECVGAERARDLLDLDRVAA